jgi:DNA-binding HxlR family transcriptional regulator
MSITLTGVLADRDSWTAAGRCSIERAFGVVGTRSAVLLLREAFYGATRFDDLARRAGLTDAAASTRLKELVAAGILAREPYREPGRRTRHEYVLTESGRELFPLLVGLLRWGDRHAAAVPGGPVRFEHEGCGAPLEVEVRCAAGHRVTPEETAAGTRPNGGSA